MPKIFAKKKWGQNFLTDSNLLDKIIRTINLHPDDNVLEIGPGEGALTERILPRVKNLAAIELDPRLVDYLKSILDLDSCHLIHGDVLLLELVDLPIPRPVRVIGNIPYNITSPILFWLIEQRRFWSDAHIMVQKELAERLTAPVGIKAYGRLTVMTSVFLEVTNCFTIPPEVFIPRPKVYSAIIKLIPKEKPLVPATKFQRFEKVVAAAFSQRRKMLRNSLKGFGIPKPVREEIDMTRRPETLTVEEFVRLAG